MSNQSPLPEQDTSETWLAALARVMASVTANADREGVLDALARGLVEEFGAALARIWLYDPADDAMHARATAGNVRDLSGSTSRIPFRDARWPIARAIANRQVVVIEEIGPESGIRDLGWVEREGLRSFAGFPLVIGDRLIGAMVVYRRAPLRAPMRDALGVLAQQAALVLEHARLIEESHTLQGIAAELASARDTRALLDGIVERTMAALGTDACAVWLLDERGELWPGAKRGLSDEFIQRLTSGSVRASSSSFELIQRTGRPVFTRDDVATLRARSVEAGDTFAAEGIVSALRLPLYEPGGHVNGMLALYHRRERLYSEDEIRLAQAFTDQIAVAIHNARLAEQEREARQAAARQMERLTTLAQITEQLLGTTEPQTVLRVVVEAAVRLCGAKGAVVGLIDSSRQRISPAATHGELRAWFETFTDTVLDDVYLAQTATGQAITRGEAVLLADYTALPAVNVAQVRTAEAGVRSFIAAPLRKNHAVLGILWVADTVPGTLTQDDATLVQALADQAALALDQARLIEESHALQGIAAQLASTRETGKLLEGIVHCTMGVLGADACAVWLLDEATRRLSAGAHRGLSPAFFELLARRQSRTAAAFQEIQRSGRAIYWRDAQAEARAHDAALAEILATEGIVSTLRLPLFEVDGRVTGMLALYHRRERVYGEDEIRLAQAFTDQIAVALQNARLAEQERAAREAASRQLERLTALAQITEQLLGTTETEAVLQVVVDAAWRLCNAGGAMVSLIEPDRRSMRAAAVRGTMRGLFAQHASGRALNDGYMTYTATGKAITEGTIVVVEDYMNWPAPDYVRESTLSAGARAFIVAPLRIGGVTIGVLWAGDTEPRAWTAEDIALMEALADQAALAIEHTRLVRRGQDAAVLEERARLARDLHDSVTQSIFSLGMMARAAQTQHARGAEALGRTLDRIGTLAQEALTEMRALLFELRPSALAEEGLAAALDQLVASFRVRMDLPISFETTGPAGVRLPPEVETAVFRIVQEALGNAAKHARATQVTVALAVDDERMTITVSDNGAGFDPNAVAASAQDGRNGGMGMQTMRERAASAGVALRITSAPGSGTTVVVEAPLSE